MTEAEAEALKRLIPILGRVCSPPERATMVSYIKGLTEGRTTGLLDLTHEHLGVLAWPSSVVRAVAFEGALDAAVDSGAIVSMLHYSGDCRSLLIEDLQAWPECPEIDSDSPLAFWLPEQASRCEQITAPTLESNGEPESPTSPSESQTAQSASGVHPWKARTPHGFMRCDKTSGGRLVHLAEVAAHLSSGPHAMPRVEVIDRLWSPLIIAASEGRQPAVYMTNSQDYARPLFVNNLLAGWWWGGLPDVNEKSSSEDLLRALADGWERCWPGLSDPSKDPEYMYQQATKGRRERDEELRRRIFWPDDGFLQNLLNRIAVPLALAAELWGYVVEPLDQAATLPVASAASVVDSKPETAGTSCPSDAEHQGLMVPPIQAQPAPAKRIRRDLLTPLLDKAVQDCEGDPNQVFMRLREWASEKPPRQPLRGATEDGLQWVDANDKPQTLNIEALKKRLRRRQ